MKAWPELLPDRPVRGVVGWVTGLKGETIESFLLMVTTVKLQPT